MLEILGNGFLNSRIGTTLKIEMWFEIFFFGDNCAIYFGGFLTDDISTIYVSYNIINLVTYSQMMVCAYLIDVGQRKYFIAKH